MWRITDVGLRLNEETDKGVDFVFMKSCAGALTAAAAEAGPAALLSLSALFGSPDLHQPVETI